jgi:hypothetical protein
MKKHFYLLFVCLLLIPVLVPAQTAAEVERLIGTDAVSYEQAARFVLEAADVPGFSSGRSASEAFRYAADNKWLPKNASAEDEACLSGVALLIMESFGIKGGIFYSMTKNSHYAYRELMYKSIIQGRTDPQMSIAGNYLLFLIGKSLEYTEGE